MSGTIGVIIPSYCRPQALRRAADYWSHSSLPVLIVDGSPEPTLIKFAENIKYEHHPTSPMQVRILAAAKSYSTEYLVLCADDDFFGLGALKIAAEFLDRSPKFSAVQGWGGTFSYDSRTLNWNLPDYLSEVFEAIEDDPIRRMRSLFEPYRQIFYSVFRLQTFIDGFQSIQSTSSLFIQEINQNVVAALSGHVCSLPIFLNARDRTPGVSMLISPERRPFAEWILDPQTNADRESWKHSVSGIAQKYHPSISTAEIEVALDDVLLGFTTIGSADRENFKTNLRNSVRGVAAKFEPISLKRKRWARSLNLASKAEYPLGPDSPNHQGNIDYWLAAQQDWTLIRDVIVNNEPAI